MSDALAYAPPRTLDEFLDWAGHQAERFEWDGVQPIAMTGGRLGHALLASRVAGALERRLEGGPCTAFRADAAVLTERGSRVRYPDVVVTCGPVRAADLAVPDPVLVVEVLSDSTAAVDRGVKRAEYTALPSLRRYVVLVQDDALALVCDRETGFEERQERGALALPEFGPTLPLADPYAGLLDG